MNSLSLKTLMLWLVMSSVFLAGKAQHHYKPKRCDCGLLIKQAKNFARYHNYPGAIKKLNSAKACNPMRAIQIEKQIEEIFKNISKRL